MQCFGNYQVDVAQSGKSLGIALRTSPLGGSLSSKFGREGKNGTEGRKVSSTADIEDHAGRWSRQAKVIPLTLVFV